MRSKLKFCPLSVWNVCQFVGEKNRNLKKEAQNLFVLCVSTMFCLVCVHECVCVINVLICFQHLPIMSGLEGVCQLVNKMDEASGKVKSFNRNDEQFLEAFTIFCGLGIQNTQMYETVERAMAKQEVTLEVRDTGLRSVWTFTS